MIVAVIKSNFGQETASFGLWIKFPPAYLSTTHGKDCVMFLLKLRTKQQYFQII